MFHRFGGKGWLPCSRWTRLLAGRVARHGSGCLVASGKRSVTDEWRCGGRHRAALDETGPVQHMPFRVQRVHTLFAVNGLSIPTAD